MGHFDYGSLRKATTSTNTKSVRWGICKRDKFPKYHFIESTCFRRAGFRIALSKFGIRSVQLSK